MRLSRAAWNRTGTCNRSEKRLRRLEQDAAQSDDALGELEAAAQKLGEQWDDVVVAYRESKQRAEEARLLRQQARASAHENRKGWHSASSAWKAAERRYWLFRQLLLLEVSRREGARPEYDCTPVSTRQYRRMLEADVVDLAGMNVDHIVPSARRSLRARR